MTIDELFLFGAASVALKLALCYSGWKRRPRRAEFVGRVTGLTLYPAKSMRGIALEEGECTHAGIKQAGTEIYDRGWMVTTGEDTRFVTGRQAPTLLLVQPSLSADGREICFDAPGMDTLRIPVEPPASASDLKATKVWGEEVGGRDCGEEAARWISRYLGDKPPGHRLLYHNPSNAAVTSRSAWSLARKPVVFRDSVKPQDKLSFHDDGPYLLTTQASLDSLNDRLKQDAVTMETFRPTIIVTGNQEAFDEDKWSELYIGENTKFTTMMPCARCMLTTFDPVSATKRENNEPVNTMKSFRKILKTTESPCFGTYLVCDWPGSIRLGDSVYALRKQ